MSTLRALPWMLLTLLFFVATFVLEDKWFIRIVDPIVAPAWFERWVVRFFSGAILLVFLLAMIKRLIKGPDESE